MIVPAPDVVTELTGRATVPVRFADNLTRWKATACAATSGSRFGMGATTVRTRQPLMARLQAPRFFVVGDTVTLSGLFNNNTNEPMTVRPALEARGLNVTAVVQDGRPVKSDLDSITIPARGEARVDWLVAVERHGEATVRLVATGNRHSDAMEKTYAIHEHGIEKFLARGGKVRGEAVTFTMEIPEQRRTESTVVEVSVASSMAVTMLDALPYLVDYPYGCTEQTMSRFLPAVVTARTLCPSRTRCCPSVTWRRTSPSGCPAPSAGATIRACRRCSRSLDSRISHARVPTRSRGGSVSA